MSGTVEEAEAMVAAQERNPEVVLAVGFTLHYHSALRVIKRLIGGSDPFYCPLSLSLSLSLSPPPPEPRRSTSLTLSLPVPSAEGELARSSTCTGTSAR